MCKCTLPGRVATIALALPTEKDRHHAGVDCMVAIRTIHEAPVRATPVLEHCYLTAVHALLAADEESIRIRALTMSLFLLESAWTVVSNADKYTGIAIE